MALRMATLYTRRLGQPRLLAAPPFAATVACGDYWGKLEILAVEDLRLLMTGTSVPDPGP